MHYLRNDTRINVMKNLIEPFQKQLKKIEEICKKDDFDYWDSIYADDIEHLVGLVYIILQNYINSSISDLYPNLSKLHLKYSQDKTVNIDSKTTRVELIISLANYYKHRDLPTELHKNTTKHLDDVKIEYKEIYDYENNKYFHKLGADSPVFSGLSLLSETWEFNDLIDIVLEWRENLWLNEEKNKH